MVVVAVSDGKSIPPLFAAKECTEEKKKRKKKDTSKVGIIVVRIRM